MTERLKDNPLGANLENLISGVKNFLPANKDLTVTKITESLMDPASASSSAIAKTEHYLYFDPRSANARGIVPASAAQSRQPGMPGALGGSGSSSSGSLAPPPGTGASFGQRRQGFAEAVVFAVGGGSMDEYGNLQDWARRTSGGVSSGTGALGGVGGGVGSSGVGGGAGAGGGAAGAAGLAGAVRKRVVYGSTELVNAEEFVMGELRRLGQESS